MICSRFYIKTPLRFEICAREIVKNLFTNFLRNLQIIREFLGLGKRNFHGIVFI